VFDELFRIPLYMDFDDGPDLINEDIEMEQERCPGVPEKIYAFHPTIPHESHIAEVGSFVYEHNFKAYFVDSIVFFFQDEERGKYSVVFGEIGRYKHNMVGGARTQKGSFTNKCAGRSLASGLGTPLVTWKLF
jgi:hypothetical protein